MLFLELTIISYVEIWKFMLDRIMESAPMKQDARWLKGPSLEA